MIKIEFDTDNAAFQGDNEAMQEERLGYEVARILRNLGSLIEKFGLDSEGDVIIIKDVNGNRIGKLNYIGTLKD